METSSEPLVFAHPADMRAKGKAALAKYGSLRKASKATGIPHTTLAYWKNHGVFDKIGKTALDDLEDANAADYLDVPKSPDEAETDKDMHPAGREEDLKGQGDVVRSGTSAGITPLVQGPPAQPGEDYVGLGGQQDWFPDSPQGLKAFYRYVNSILSGSRPDAAQHAASVIDPDFGLSDYQNTQLMNSLTSLMMADVIQAYEPLQMPDFVGDLLDQFGIDDDGIGQLIEFVFGIVNDSYVEVINANLQDCGQQGITSLNDPTLLSKLRTQAQGTARSIANTYNSQLASMLGQAWVNLSAVAGNNPVSPEILTGAIQRWVTVVSNRNQSMIPDTEACRACFDAQLEWQLQNGTAAQARLSSGDPICDACQQICDDNSEWSDDVAGVFASMDETSHPGCMVSIQLNHIDVPLSQPLWRG